MRIKKINKRNTKSKSYPVIVAAALLLVCCGLFWAWKHFSSGADNPNKQNTTLNENTKGIPKQPEEKTSDGADVPDNDQGGTATSQKTGDVTNQPIAALRVPEGTFVSNHRPKLSGGMDAVQSTCTTTPGATCQIQFTNGNTVKQLEARKTDAGGGAYWSWKLGDIGLTKGTWKVTATATASGQTQTADDPLSLEVGE